eukprot:2012955-Lingulodinium_polyedra.AAC.1
MESVSEALNDQGTTGPRDRAERSNAARDGCRSPAFQTGNRLSNIPLATDKRTRQRATTASGPRSTA